MLVAQNHNLANNSAAEAFLWPQKKISGKEKQGHLGFWFQWDNVFIGPRCIHCLDLSFQNIRSNNLAHCSCCELNHVTIFGLLLDGPSENTMMFSKGSLKKVSKSILAL